MCYADEFGKEAEPIVPGSVLDFFPVDTEPAPVSEARESEEGNAALIQLIEDTVSGQRPSPPSPFSINDAEYAEAEGFAQGAEDGMLAYNLERLLNLSDDEAHDLPHPVTTVDAAFRGLLLAAANLSQKAQSRGRYGSREEFADFALLLYDAVRRQRKQKGL